MLLALVCDRGLVDPDRICMEGGSYGGYSALMSTILRPERYRCAASLNGVTDVPLLFIAGDIAQSEPGRRWFVEIVGDPETDLAHLMAISPVFRIEDLRVPVFVAQGSKDVRVDPEHAYRLREALRQHLREGAARAEVGSPSGERMDRAVGASSPPRP